MTSLSRTLPYRISMWISKFLTWFLSLIVGTEVRLDDYEKTLTVVFSVVLGLSMLGLVMYQMIRCHQRRVQYSHQPLIENTGKP